MWVVMPTAKPNIEYLQKWRDKGYEIGLFLDRGVSVLGDFVPDLLAQGTWTTTPDAWNLLVDMVFRQCKDEKCVLLAADDVYPDSDHTSEDVEADFLKRFPDAFGVVKHTGDSFGAQRAIQHPLIGREWRNRFGFAMPTGYYHYCTDCELFELANALDCYQENSDVVFYHDHYLKNNEECPAVLSSGNAAHPFDLARLRAIINELSTGWYRGRELLSWKLDDCIEKKRGEKLGVVMIVKNEEACLQKCIDSVRGVDEIIVFDTGSTDRTEEIALLNKDCNLSFIKGYQWSDSFSEARNEALKHSTADWVLSIDADETLCDGGVEMLREDIRIANAKFTNCLYNRLYASGGDSQHHAIRVFFRLGAEWRGHGHETVHVIGPHSLGSKATLTYARSPAHDQDPERMLRIMQKCVDEDRSARNLFYLAREHLYRAEWKKAADLYLECIELTEWNMERTEAYLQLARCLWKLQKGDDARLACSQALVANPNFGEAAVFMAEMCWDHNKPPWLAMAKAATNEGLLFKRNYVIE